MDQETDDAREQDLLRQMIDTLNACTNALRGDAEEVAPPTTRARETKVMTVPSWRALYERAAADAPSRSSPVRMIYLQDLTRATPDEFEQILVGINHTCKLTALAADWLARELTRPRASLGGKSAADGLVFNNRTNQFETLAEQFEETRHEGEILAEQAKGESPEASREAEAS